MEVMIDIDKLRIGTLRDIAKDYGFKDSEHNFDTINFFNDFVKELTEKTEVVLKALVDVSKGV